MSLQNVSISVPEEMVFFLSIDEDQSELESLMRLLSVFPIKVPVEGNPRFITLI